jgi:ketosteroid isomerase-like protein
VIDLSANVLNPGVHEGFEGYRRFVDEVGEAWAEFRMEPEEFFEAGEDVVVFVRARGTGHGSGLQVDADVAVVCRLRDGKLAWLHVEPDREAALRSVGLR